MAKRKISKEQELKIVKLYKSGKSSVHISRIFNVHCSTVLNKLRKHIPNEIRHPLPPRPTCAIEITDKIIKVWVKEYNEGWNYEDIGQRYKVSSNTVWRHLNKKIKSRLRGGGLHSRTVRNISKLEAAYLAGILDGEGSITVVKSKQKNQGLRILICIVNTDRELMRWLESIGGPPVRWRKGTNKMVGCWNICGVNDAWYLLNKVKPFLIVKLEKAEKALEILKQRRHYKNKSKAYKRWYGSLQC